MSSALEFCVHSVCRFVLMAKVVLARSRYSCSDQPTYLGGDTCPNYYSCKTNENPDAGRDPCSCLSYCGYDTRCCASTHFDADIAALAELEAHLSGATPITDDALLIAKSDQVAQAIKDGVTDWTASFDLTALSALALEQQATLIPTAEAPIGPGQGIQWVLMTVLNHLALHSPAEEVLALPAAEVFPGPLATGAAALTNVELLIDATYRGYDSLYWYSQAGKPVMRSTGLWAAAGEAITVQIPESAANNGLEVLIGCHTDTLKVSGEYLQGKRYHEITRSYALDTTTTAAANSFGGLVYITVPQGTELGEISITISNAYAAPRFRLGDTTDQEWEEVNRDLPAPWAELEAPSFIITVPSAEARRVTSPTALMQMWERILEGSATLEGYPAGYVRPRVERMVMDLQINNGWMHSGYPVMGPQQVSWSALLDIEAIATTDSAWGPVHELGHNFQYKPWTWSPTTETSCNLWSVYYLEVTLNAPASALHNQLRDDVSNKLERRQDYFENGPQYSDWRVWSALDTFLDLKSEFGWDFYGDVFASYRELISGGDGSFNSLNDDGKMNAWVKRTSVIADANLGPFYLRWGFPVSSEILTEVAGLPRWDPRGSVCSTLALDVDMDLIQPGSSARQTFETNFKSDMATILGVDASRVHVWGVTGESAIVDFAIVPSMITGAPFDAASLNAAFTENAATFENLSSQTELNLPTGSIPVQLGEVQVTGSVNCVGSWSSCGADCADKTYTVTTAQSGTGDECAAAHGATAACAAGEGSCPQETVRSEKASGARDADDAAKFASVIAAGLAVWLH